MTTRRAGYPTEVISTPDLVRRAPISGLPLHAASLGSIGLCIGLWIRAKTVDQEERGNAERRAICVGLWAPTLWEMGDPLGDVERVKRCRLGSRYLPG